MYPTGWDLTAVSTNISWGNIGNLDYIPAIGRAAYVSGVTGGKITLSNCTLKLYAWAKGDKEPQNWVTLENGTVTPDVDGALKSAEWDTEVTLSNNVKVTKLKERPTPPEWAEIAFPEVPLRPPQSGTLTTSKCHFGKLKVKP